MTGTSRPHEGTSNTLLTDNPLRVQYKGPNAQAEIVTLTFPNPVIAEFVSIQAVNTNMMMALAEVKIIKCRKLQSLMNLFIKVKLL